MRLPCPYLGGDVEWTEEREHHIATRHPELVPTHRDRVVATLADPDEVRRHAEYTDTRLFVRWFGELMGGKNVVVATVSTLGPDVRHWIVTAWMTGRPAKGELEWKRP
ncbi:MAG: hypothetical protein A3D33_03945 [Candidatus Rokubacteria bacterium RIFCSPHIGHO2_02_FULL_73_26]|nr:MAG: hypothetical protein A3D33_03945 [Candidatus Rokubacteria bacterium RIFCSPHIGHO2_02_FULL_73_26]OGL22765.1 MAG: hypothetical protein A3G44_14670 [Candidatus Rokubacteria bacterium RIFCSPLOWO2_12_FULL_73_47]